MEVRYGLHQRREDVDQRGRDDTGIAGGPQGGIALSGSAQQESTSRICVHGFIYIYQRCLKLKT